MVDDSETSADAIYARYQFGRRQYLVREALDADSQQISVSGTGATPGAFAGPGGVGEGGGEFGGGPCFIGETRVPMFDGTDYALSYLYQYRKRFVGKLVKSFDSRNNVWPGEILQIHKNTIHEILNVQFKGEPSLMGMARLHRFWTTWYDFESMASLTKTTKVFNHDDEWGYSTVELKKRITFPDGIDVYNLHVKTYNTYFAYAPGGKPKAVHNLKPIDTF